MDFYSYLIYGVPVQPEELFSKEKYQKLIDICDKFELSKQDRNDLEEYKKLYSLKNYILVINMYLFYVYPNLTFHAMCPYQEADHLHINYYLSSVYHSTSNTKPMMIIKRELETPDTTELKMCCDDLGIQYGNCNWYLNFHIE